MGYYTNFAIEIRTYVTKEVAKSIVDSINNQISFKAFSLYEPSNVNDTDETSWDLEPGDEMKWYKWESDMDAIAQKYPKFLLGQSQTHKHFLCGIRFRLY